MMDRFQDRATKYFRSATVKWWWNQPLPQSLSSNPSGTSTGNYYNNHSESNYNNNNNYNNHQQFQSKNQSTFINDQIQSCSSSVDSSSYYYNNHNHDHILLQSSSTNNNDLSSYASNNVCDDEDGKMSSIIMPINTTAVTASPFKTIKEIITSPVASFSVSSCTVSNSTSTTNYHNLVNKHSNNIHFNTDTIEIHHDIILYYIANINISIILVIIIIVAIVTLN